MAAASGNKVLLQTFLKWSVDNVIGYNTEDSDNKTWIIKVWCKLCAAQKAGIIRDSRVKGQIKKEIDRFASGTNFVTKHSVLRHFQSVGHKIASELENAEGKLTF